MGKTVPMLSDAKQLKAWEMLEGSRSKRRKSSDTSFQRALDAIKALQNPDGVLIQHAAEIAYSEFPTAFKDMVLGLDQKLTEESPDAALHIADLLLNVGDITFAESVMSKAGDTGDRELSCRIRGKIGMRLDDRENAVDDLIEAWSLNPTDSDTYDLLEELEPDYGWQYIRCIEMMWIEGDLRTPEKDYPCAYAELYDCCCAWNAGRRADAMNALQASDRFHTDSYFQVTYARMSLVTGVYANALESYNTALRMSPGFVFAMSEAASAMRLSGDYQGAIDMCRTALERYPGCRTAMEQMIRAAADSGRKHETDGYIARYLTLQPEDATAYAFCASVLFDTGFPMEATNLVKRMESRCTDRAYAHLQMSIDEARNGDWKKAVNDANQAKKIEPENIECMCQCSKAYLGIGNLKNAEKEANAAMAAAPNNISAMSVKKEVYIAQGKNDLALELLDRIVALVPRDASVRKDRADLLGEMGRYTEALDAYRESLNIRDDIRLFISVIKKMLKERKIKDLCRFVDDYDDSYGSSPEVWMIRGNGEYLSGMFEEAAGSYARACMLSYSDPVIWHSKGLAEQKAGDLNAAQASFDRAIILDLENPDYWISKASVQEEIGDVSGAVMSVNKVIGLAPNNVYALVMKARLMASVRMYDEALFFLDLALRIKPNEVRIYHLKKDICMHIGRYKEAEAICSNIMQMDKQNLDVQVDRVMALLGDGRHDEALACMNELHNRHNGEYAVMKGEARFYCKMMENDKAVEKYRALIAAFPDDRDSAEELLSLYRTMGLTEEADALDRELHPVTESEEPVSVIDEDAPEPEPEAPGISMEDAVSSREAGDSEAAEVQLRDIMEHDLSSPDPFLMYIDLMVEKGDVRAALDTAKKARSLFSSDTRVVKALGDTYMEDGDMLSALTSYGEAVELGMTTPDLFLKKGEAEYELSLYQRALDSFNYVIREDSANRAALIGSCRVLMKLSRRDEAAPVLDTILAMDPSDTEALKMRTEVFLWHNDEEGVLSLYPSVEEYVTEPSDLEFFSDALRSIGEDGKASALFSPVEFGGSVVDDEPIPEDGPAAPVYAPVSDPAPVEEVPITEDDGFGHMERTEEELESMAVDILSRAMDTGLSADDPDLYIGLDSWDTESVRKLFRTPQKYPFINPGDCFFDDMESVSYDIIVGEGLTDMESSPVVSLEVVYRHCRHKELEYVRRMQAYINYAMTNDDDPIRFSKKVDDIASGIRSRACSIYDIMKEYGVGVYTAATAKKLSRQ